MFYVIELRLGKDDKPYITRSSEPYQNSQQAEKLRRDWGTNNEFDDEIAIVRVFLERQKFSTGGTL